MEGQVKAQLRSSLERRSKILRDRERIEAVVEVAGTGRLVLNVDGAGGYSLRGYPEGDEALAGTLLAVGVMRSDEIVAVRARETPGGSEHDPG